MLFRFALLSLLLIGTTARAQEAWYKRDHGRAPTDNTIYLCHGYTCRIVTPVRFGPDDLASIATPLSRELTDGAAERAAISKVVQAFERYAGARAGTAHDLPKMQFGRGADDQMDCIDEATNTTSLLLFLKQHGYLKHHTVMPPSARGFFLDGRYPHATAVLTDKGSGEKWAIDSWPNANGGPPVIQPLAEWKRSRTSGGDES